MDYIFIMLCVCVCVDWYYFLLTYTLFLYVSQYIINIFRPVPLMETIVQFPFPEKPKFTAYAPQSYLSEVSVDLKIVFPII